MIRKLKEQDLSAVMEIWLSSNFQAHGFVPRDYWKNNYETVKKMLPQSDVYVDSRGGRITAFIGLNGDFIAGLFVSSDMRSRGIGKELLDYCKDRCASLSLCVYQENQKALHFYLREGFRVERVATDRAVGKTEYRMVWKNRQEAKK